MNLCKIGLITLAGFFLGVLLSHVSKAKANPQLKEGTVHVFIVPVEMLSAKGTSSQDLPGYKVAGISCIPKPQKILPDAAVCYVATTLATQN